MKIIGAGILFLLLVLVPISNAAVIYKWVDKNGSVNFTDDISKVPPEYRDQIQTEETKDIEKTQTPSSAPASIQKTGEEKRDVHGRGEEYWRETVRPWKKQLKQGQEDYQNTNIKIEDAIEVAKGRFLSKTQYNFKRQELDRLMEERGIYEAKRKEAEEMLAKIGKEAEEAKADPAWLK
jgi:tRNA/tmRNA/rRNA uracil-C5-methylase (TrmA/RlmC/RlmD family)